MLIARNCRRRSTAVFDCSSDEAIFTQTIWQSCVFGYFWDCVGVLAGVDRQSARVLCFHLLKQRPAHHSSQLSTNNNNNNNNKHITLDTHPYKNSWSQSLTLIWVQNQILNKTELTVPLLMIKRRKTLGSQEMLKIHSDVFWSCPQYLDFNFILALSVITMTTLGAIPIIKF